MTDQKNGIIKIIAGALLTIIGMLGVIFGKNATSRLTRIPMILISICLIGTGWYLVIDGIDDVALGKVGAYKLEGPINTVQTLTYKSPQAFREGLKLNAKNQPEIRRITFKCPDNSDGFKVLVNPYYPLGVPSEDVICKDGFKLISYAQ